MGANIEIAQLRYKQNNYQETIQICNTILVTDSNSIEALKLIAKYLKTLKYKNTYKSSYISNKFAHILLLELINLGFQDKVIIMKWLTS